MSPLRLFRGRAVYFFLAALLLGATASVDALGTSAQLARVVRAEGRVVRRHEGRPVVAFTARDGRVVEFSPPGQMGRGLAPGASVPVLYDPAEPHGARFAGVAWLRVQLSLGLAGLLALAGAIALRMERRADTDND